MDRSTQVNHLKSRLTEAEADLSHYTMRLSQAYAMDFPDSEVRRIENMYRLAKERVVSLKETIEETELDPEKRGEKGAVDS